MLLHVWMSHVVMSQMNESCEMSPVCHESALQSMQRSWYAITTNTLYDTWLIHVWHDSFMCEMNRSCDMDHSCVTWLIHMCHDSFMVTWCIQICHDSFMCHVTHLWVIWLIQVLHASFTCDVTHSCVTWRIHVWHDSFPYDMTYSCVAWHDTLMLTIEPPPPRGSLVGWFDPRGGAFFLLNASISRAKRNRFQRNRRMGDPYMMTPSCATWLVHVFIWDMTHQEKNASISRAERNWFQQNRRGKRSYMIWLPPVQLDSCIYLYETWPIHVWYDSLNDPLMCDMTHSNVTWLNHTGHDSFICDMTSSGVIWLIRVFIWDTTHPYVTWLIHVWYDSLLCDMTQPCI